jgi:putative colanic acid biosynthesis acetyltransferase WcaF
VRLDDRACIGDRANLYSLGHVSVGARAVVAQEAYLCTGTHNFEDRNLPLMTGAIEIGADAFVGARAFILPGVLIGEGAVVGACSLVTKNVPSWSVWAGSPASFVRARRKI